MVERTMLVRRVETALRRNPIVVLLGPRQCGKTTLAGMIAARRKSDYFDLESPADLARLSSPMLSLERLRGLVIIDEVQRRPELFEVLRVLADRPNRRAKFLLLGSASLDVVRGVSESLAGRAAFIEMDGFDLSEVGLEHVRRLWVRGGFPRSFLARSEADSRAWRSDFIRTFLQRDIPQLGISIPAQALRRFWTMVAHYHGQVWNAAEFAGSLGTSEKTARRYLDLLAGAYVLRQLQPWHENLRKRQVKALKMYVRDPGLLHSLLSLDTYRDLLGHPKMGASWEGFCIEQVLAFTGAEDAYFWSTHAGAGIDLLVFKSGKRIGFEFKCSDAPRMTRSLHNAKEDLRLHKAFVIYPGDTSYRIDEDVEVVSIGEIHSIARRC